LNRSPRKRSTEFQIEPAFLPIAAAFADDPKVSLGRRFGSNSVLSVQGKIFCMFTRGAFVAKLPASRIRDLTQAGMGRPYEPGPGRVMKEWIAMERGNWMVLAREAYTFVNLGSSKSRANRT